MDNLWRLFGANRHKFNLAKMQTMKIIMETMHGMDEWMLRQDNNTIGAIKKTSRKSLKTFSSIQMPATEKETKKCFEVVLRRRQRQRLGKPILKFTFFFVLLSLLDSERFYNSKCNSGKSAINKSIIK